MAGGWMRDGAVNEQIEASIEAELKRMQNMRRLVGAGLTHWAGSAPRPGHHGR